MIPERDLLSATDLVETLTAVLTSGELSQGSRQKLAAVIETLIAPETNALSDHVLSELGFHRQAPGTSKFGWAHYNASLGLGGVFYERLSASRLLDIVHRHGIHVGDGLRLARIKEALS